MDLAVVSPPAPRKKTALESFSLLSPGEASCLSKFLSPHPAKRSKTTSTGCSRTTFIQPGYSPRSTRGPAHPSDGKGGLESSWGWAWKSRECQFPLTKGCLGKVLTRKDPIHCNSPGFLGCREVSVSKMSWNKVSSAQVGDTRPAHGESSV